MVSALPIIVSSVLQPHALLLVSGPRRLLTLTGAETSHAIAATLSQLLASGKLTPSCRRVHSRWQWTSEPSTGGTTSANGLAKAHALLFFMRFIVRDGCASEWWLKVLPSIWPRTLLVLVLRPEDGSAKQPLREPGQPFWTLLKAQKQPPMTLLWQPGSSQKPLKRSPRLQLFESQ